MMKITKEQASMILWAFDVAEVEAGELSPPEMELVESLKGFLLEE